MKRRATTGWSLIELVICMGIISILAAIVLPRYQHYIMRTNQAATQQYLLELFSLQHQAMFDNQGYAERVEALGAVPLERVATNYDIAISNVDNSSHPPTFSIQALPKQGSAHTASSPLTINHLGQKSAGWYE
jgi:type IV pilus assembly protein PilE|tara:strand:- start:7951 stop:8349 length:399 start_codon:yes stop_codon:yes gene_type:complete